MNSSRHQVCSQKDLSKIKHKRKRSCKELTPAATLPDPPSTTHRKKCIDCLLCYVNHCFRFIPRNTHASADLMTKLILSFLKTEDLFLACQQKENCFAQEIEKFVNDLEEPAFSRTQYD